MGMVKRLRMGGSREEEEEKNEDEDEVGRDVL